MIIAAAIGLLALALVYELSRTSEASTVITDPTQPEPRGLRNNNPGNIVYSAANNWQGQVGTDGKYAIFSDPYYGIRAMFKVLSSYRKKGISSISAIIIRWAPKEDNEHVSEYINFVTKNSHMRSPLTEVPGNKQYANIVAAIIQFENGYNPFALQYIKDIGAQFPVVPE